MNDPAQALHDETQNVDEERVQAAQDADEPVEVEPPPVAPSPQFVYAVGRIEPRFPTLGCEKEFAQVAGRDGTEGLTDRQALRAMLSERRNRYLARQLCWTFCIEGIETYILRPRDPADLDLLLEALRPTPRHTDVDVVIGELGPIAPAHLCNALMVPIVAFDQLYSFDGDELINSIPRPESMEAEQFEAVAEELFSRIVQMSDNAGATDGDRALNYLSVRYPRIYHLAAERVADNCSLEGLEVRPSRLGGPRKVLDVVFSFRDRRTDVADKFFVRVDVTEEFPFLTTKLSPYFERSD